VKTAVELRAAFAARELSPVELIDAAQEHAELGAFITLTLERAREEAKLAERAMQELRPEQRQVLVLSTCHGMSHEEISQATGMPLGTVKAHVRRGLIHVREVLGIGQASPAESGRTQR